MITMIQAYGNRSWKLLRRREGVGYWPPISEKDSYNNNMIIQDAVYMATV